MPTLSAPRQPLLPQRNQLSRLIMAIVACFLLIAAVPLTAAERERAGLSAASLVDSPRVLVVAHRGNSSRAPENTLAAFNAAIDAGADLIELDYHHTADGVPVVMHDDTLDRTTDARARWQAERILLRSKRLAELRELDAGGWFSEAFAGQHVPTLSEALDTIQRGSMTLIERKHGDAATCVRLLKEKQLLDQVVVQAFDWRYLADCHRLAPTLVLGALGHGDVTPERLDEVEKTGARLVVWHQKSLDREAIELIHDRGFRAWTFTVNDLDRAAELIDDGIDAIITDIPAEVRKRGDRQGAAEDRAQKTSQHKRPQRLAPAPPSFRSLSRLRRNELVPQASLPELSAMGSP